MADPNADPVLWLVSPWGSDAGEAQAMSFPELTAGDALPRVMELIEKLEFHQTRMEELLAAILELSHPDDDLAVECRRLLTVLTDR
jgi:hypothetical protein